MLVPFPVTHAKVADRDLCPTSSRRVKCEQQDEKMDNVHLPRAVGKHDSRCDPEGDSEQADQGHYWKQDER